MWPRTASTQPCEQHTARGSPVGYPRIIARILCYELYYPSVFCLPITSTSLQLSDYDK